MELTKARMRPSRRLVSVTMGKASTPHSRSTFHRSRELHEARPEKKRAMLSATSPTNSTTLRVMPGQASVFSPTVSRKPGSGLRAPALAGGTARAMESMGPMPPGRAEVSIRRPRAFCAMAVKEASSMLSHSETSARRRRVSASPRASRAAAIMASGTAGAAATASFDHEPEARTMSVFCCFCMSKAGVMVPHCRGASGKRAVPEEGGLRPESAVRECRALGMPAACGPASERGA